MQKNEKTNEPILRKSEKRQFLGHFGPVVPNLGQMEIFPKK